MSINSKSQSEMWDVNVSKRKVLTDQSGAAVREKRE